ncbi:scarecrow-like protein 3 [Salvia miltiorrhiza]|uniref:scarecrow-like protein 3 n=1 Tax=Salvia miltiorrhiza TaxID=226208 RepID=UPI0025AB6BDC|nr:scarecrow-like protein 3 [Salvia miltiorrhiza]
MTSQILYPMNANKFEDTFVQSSKSRKVHTNSIFLPPRQTAFSLSHFPPSSLKPSSSLSLSTQQFRGKPRLFLSFSHLLGLPFSIRFFDLRILLTEREKKKKRFSLQISYQIPSFLPQMFQEDGSSSVTSSPLQMFPMMTSPHPWLKELKPEERGLCLIQLLVTCAGHVASNNLESANAALDQISHLASPYGDTMQRIASYFSEALADRILRSWPGVYKAFNSTRVPAVAEEIAARRIFFELLPFLKVASVISNQAIVEAMEGEKMVHVIDLNAAEPAQWRALIRDLSARPEGPPHLRITAVHHRREALEEMARVLTEEAENLDIPFQFNPIVEVKLENLDFEKLRVKTGEALAVNSVMQLHTLLATGGEDARGGGRSPSNDSGSSSPPLSASSYHSPSMENFLSAIWGLSPKVMVVAEQDSDHNGRSMMERLSESLYFYAALFDCTESALPRGSLERMKMERMVLGEEIKNIVACEGAERRERHERLERWSRRLEVAGFVGAPLSYYALLQAKRLLQSYKCEGYKIKEENGSVVICWQDRPLYSVSAWRFRR